MIKWETEWWGIILIAETEDDKKPLTQFYDYLSKSPERYYEDGTLEIETDSNNKIKKITFER